MNHHTATPSPTAPSAQPCFECENGVMLPIIEDYQTTLKDLGEVTVPNVPMERCNLCGDTVIGDQGNRLIDEHLDRITQAITSEEIRVFLEKYQLTQKSASQITGLGEKNISRWLSGKMRPSTSVSNFLRLLIADEKAFERLKLRNWAA